MTCWRQTGPPPLLFTKLSHEHAVADKQENFADNR